MVPLQKDVLLTHLHLIVVDLAICFVHVPLEATLFFSFITRYNFHDGIVIEPLISLVCLTVPGQRNLFLIQDSARCHLVVCSVQ